MLWGDDYEKYTIRFTNEHLITLSGLKTGDILLSYIGLLCQGKTEYEAIKERNDDPDFS